MKYWCYYLSANGTMFKKFQRRPGIAPISTVRICNYHLDPPHYRTVFRGWVVYLDTHGVQASQRKAGIQGESSQLGKIGSKTNRAGETAQCLRALVSLPGHRFDS